MQASLKILLSLYKTISVRSLTEALQTSSEISPVSILVS